MDRALIAKLLEADPEFPEFLATLHGVSKMDDSSESHVPTAATQRKRQGALAGGLLAGAAAEGLATSRAVQNAFGKDSTPRPPRTKLGGTLHRLGESPGGRRAEAAFQAANLVVGLGAARELVRKPKQDKVSKAIKPEHLEHLVRIRKTRAAVVDARNAHHDAILDAHIAGISPHSISQATGVPRQSVYNIIHAAGGVSKALTHFQPIGNVHANARAGRLGMRLPGASAGHPRRGGALIAVKKSLGLDLPETEWRGEISKLNEDKQQVFGWASLSMVDGEPVLDRQGDYIDIIEAEDAAYRYMLNSRKGGDMHRRIAKAADAPLHTADVIESMVFTPEKIEALGLEPDALPLGWWLGMQVHDEQQWDDIKTGKRTGFSVHGTGVRKDLVLT